MARLPAFKGQHSLCVVALDISEHVTRQKKLAGNEEMLRVALDTTQVALFQWDVRTDEIVWDDRMSAITGSSTALSFEEWSTGLTHPDDRERALANYEQLFTTGQMGPAMERIVRGDGETRWILLSARAFLSASGEPERVVGGVLDITEQQRLGQQLQQSQRMQAVGDLTAGIAHNFNNMLMVIQPCLDVIEGLLADDDKVWARDAIEASARAADIVAQLMTFSGQRRQHTLEEVSVAQACLSAVAICERTFDRHIDIVCDARSLALVRSESGDLEQVLMNLLLNARDAFDALGPGHKARVNLRTRDLDTEGGPRVRIEVRDNGAGMSEATRARIFDPFFTTKSEKGTGLGLASSRSIVEGIGGSIECTSSLGKGSTFTIELPVLKASTRVTERERESKAANKGAAQKRNAASSAPRVLIVDDELAIRRVVSLLLDADQIASHAVGSVAEARAQLETYANYELVLLDRSLPGAPGSEFIADLRAKAPGARIMFFTAHDLGEEEAALVDGVIHKPLRSASLMQAVHEALSANS